MLRPKCPTLLTGLAAAILSTSAALADTKADDRSYLPPQSLRAQEKSLGEQSTPQVTRQIDKIPPKSGYYTRRYYAHRHTLRYHAHRRARRYHAYRHTRRYYASRSFFPGIFFGLFH